jgi:hypothetical protein
MGVQHNIINFQSKVKVDAASQNTNDPIMVNGLYQPVMRRFEMERFPIFHREGKKTQQIDFMKNIWCPLYEECLNEAAMANCLMDCSGCKNSAIDFRKDWANRYVNDFMCI